MAQNTGIALVSTLLILASACAAQVSGDGSDPYQTHELALSDNGPNVKLQNDWGDMGVEQSGPPKYVGIDTNRPSDVGLIQSEGSAAAAAGEPHCVFGAHGNICDEQAEVQSFPSGNPDDICGCGGTMVLSICYAGQDPDGDGPNGSISELFLEQCGIAPDDVRACTGTVHPGTPMVCNGEWVDGNGTPADGFVGGLELANVDGDTTDLGPSRCDIDCDDYVVFPDETSPAPFE